MSDKVIIDEVDVYDCEFYSPRQNILNADYSVTVIECACLKDNVTTKCKGKDCYYKKYYQLKWRETKHSNSQECIINQLQKENDKLWDFVQKMNELTQATSAKVFDEFIELFDKYLCEGNRKGVNRK